MTARGNRPPLTLLRWLDSHARHRPDAIAVVDPAGNLEYTGLQRASEEWATTLLRSGLQRCRPVALAMEPSIRYVVMIIAVLRAGGVVAPVNTRLADPEVERYLDRLDPALVVFDTGSVRLAGLSRCPTLDLDEVSTAPSLGLRGPTPPASELPTLGADEPAVIFPTGGTTGLPKGAWNDHQGLALWTWNVVTSGRRAVGDVELYFSPFFHVTLVVGLFAPLMAGGTVIIEPTFDPVRALRTIEEHGVTHLMGAPTMFEALLDGAAGRPDLLDGIRRVTFGSTAASPAFVARLMAAFPNAEIGTGYGATEFASGVSRVADADLRAGRLDGVGRPLPGIDLEIRGEHGVLPAGVTGEIAVRSSWNTLGYWNDPEATAATYGDDGFIRLGDLGHLSEDGWLTVAGRLKEMIITGGENVFPAEVEAAMAGVAGVAEVVVFGVADDRWGERVEAAVRLIDGAALDLAATRTQLRSRIAPYKVPKRIHVVDRIPLTANNKPDRRALAKNHG